MELGSECSVSDPETDTRCAGPGDRIVIASRRELAWAQKNPENATGRRCSIGEAGGGTC